MQPDKLPIPLSVVRLLTAFFARTITPEQREQLDDWICADEAVNMRVFEECLEISLLPVIYDPERDDADYELSQRINLN